MFFSSQNLFLLMSPYISTITLRLHFWCVNIRTLARVISLWCHFFPLINFQSYIFTDGSRYRWSNSSLWVLLFFGPFTCVLLLYWSSRIISTFTLTNKIADAINAEVQKSKNSFYFYLSFTITIIASMIIFTFAVKVFVVINIIWISYSCSYCCFCLCQI